MLRLLAMAHYGSASFTAAEPLLRRPDEADPLDAESLHMRESAVSHAPRLLRAHRVVSVSRRGRMAFCRLDDGHVRMLVDLGLAHTGHTAAIHPEREDGQ